MNVNGLRLGNFVHEMVLGDCPIVGITANIEDDGMVWLEKDNLHYHIDSDNIEPIHLTEEWIFRFGFVREGEWVGIIFNARIGIRFFDGNPAECDIIQDDKFISFKFEHIKYVHELQNLYFVLSGNELTL